MKKIKNNLKYVLLLLFTIFPVAILKVFIKLDSREMIGSIDGWLGFLGGYFGVLGAVGTVWWQLNNEKKEKRKEEIEEKKTLLQFIFNILLDIYNRTDLTKKIIFYNLNPATKVKGNPPYFLLEEKKLDILLEKTSFLKTLDLSYKIYSIHFTTSNIEMVCKEYMFPLGELYHYFSKEIDTLKQEDFNYDYNVGNILLKIDKIGYYNIKDKSLKIFTFYLKTINLINSIAEKYVNNAQYIIPYQEYIELKKYLEISNEIGINIIDINKRMKILEFTTTFRMVLIQFENILYGKTSLDVFKKELETTLNYLKQEINNCAEAVEK